MPRTRIAFVVGLAVTALAVAGCGGSNNEAATTETGTTTETTTAPSGSTVLKGSVGPGFEISLMTGAGQAVATLAAGAYTLEVDDKSSQHNFHIMGPGVDESTTVEEIGPKTFELTLEAGTYKFQCDPHSSTMNGSFEVTG